MILTPVAAQAGMSMPTFTDIARARFDVISFFGVGYLALGFVYQRIWNSLARDFPKLPRLNYGRALGKLVVCGLFIYVVLTMISGARELMTPGAWARNGRLYELREPERDPQLWLDESRRDSLERLRAALWRYAEQHGGAFPPAREATDFPREFWRSIDPSGLLLIYMPGLKPDAGQEVLAYEPGSFGPTRFVLLCNGAVVKLDAELLKERIEKQIADMDRAPAREEAK